MKYKKFPEEQEEENIDARFRLVQFDCGLLKYIVILACLALIVWCTIITNKACKDRSFEEKILSITKGVADNSDVFMNDTMSRLEVIGRQNEKISNDHVLKVDTLLRSQKKESILRMKRIMTKTVAAIKEEVSSFTRVIEEAVRGILDFLVDDTKYIANRVDWASSSNVTSIVPIAFSDVEYAITGAFVDLDSMYTFYDDYVWRFVENRANNGTRELGIFINSNRQKKTKTLYSRMLDDENLRLCYDIASQNAKVVGLIDRCLQVISNVLNSSQILIDLNIDLCGNGNSTDACSCRYPWLREAQLVINQEFFKSNNQLNDIVNRGRYFAGAEVIHDSVVAHRRMRDNIARHTKKAVTNFDRSVNATITDFTVVRPDRHWPMIRQATYDILDSLQKSIAAKLPLVTETTTESEWKKRSEFVELKSWMNQKFKNNTRAINDDFERRKTYFGRQLKDSLTLIDRNIVPVMSILSIDNYVPTKQCGLSIAFQTVVKDILARYLSESCVKPTYKEHELCMRYNNNNNNDDDDDDVNNDNEHDDEEITVMITTLPSPSNIAEFIPFARFIAENKNR